MIKYDNLVVVKIVVHVIIYEFRISLLGILWDKVDNKKDLLK